MVSPYKILRAALQGGTQFPAYRLGNGGSERVTCPSSKQQGYNLIPDCWLSLSGSLSGKRCQSSGGLKLVIGTMTRWSMCAVSVVRGAWAQVEIRRPGSFLPPR